MGLQTTLGVSVLFKGEEAEALQAYLDDKRRPRATAIREVVVKELVREGYLEPRGRRR